MVTGWRVVVCALLVGTTTSLRSIGASRGAFRAQLACLATGTTLVLVYALLNAGHLTQAEFDQRKGQLLSQA